MQYSYAVKISSRKEEDRYVEAGEIKDKGNEEFMNVGKVGN